MAWPEIITVEDLFSSPTRAGATISPDGSRRLSGSVEGTGSTSGYIASIRPSKHAA